MNDDMNTAYTRPTDAENLNETTNEKLALMSKAPGMAVEFDPEEADLAGAFQEDAEDAVIDGEVQG